MSTLADRLKEGMSLRGLRQADIVEKTGINKGALSSYISGRYQPKQNNIFLLARALDVNEAWLMGADVPMERATMADIDEYKKDYETYTAALSALEDPEEEKHIDLSGVRRIISHDFREIYDSLTREEKRTL